VRRRRSADHLQHSAVRAAWKELDGEG
jgi:hypothetical protein